jgi:hypothetical protein
MRHCIRMAIFTFMVALAAAPALAWSGKEHVQLTRLAGEQLLADDTTPPAMKQWLAKALPRQLDMAGEEDFFLHTQLGADPTGLVGIEAFAIAPDTHAQHDPQDSKVEPYGAHEKLLHYIDLELFLAGDQKRAYRHDLSGKPKKQDIPRDMHDSRYLQAGFLPFSVEHTYAEFVKAIRDGRLLDAKGDADTDNHAIRWAAYLAHYAEDNTQPQHSTIDYKSSVYFADKRNAPNVHGQVEYAMIDDKFDSHMELRKEFWPLFVQQLQSMKDPIQTNDPWEATVEVSLASYDALPLIGLAAQAATKQGGTPDHPEGPAQKFNTETFFRFQGPYKGKTYSVMQMKAEQTAWAVLRVKRLWRQAWDEATRPTSPTGQ